MAYREELWLRLRGNRDRGGLTADSSRDDAAEAAGAERKKRALQGAIIGGIRTTQR
jgi:hypothetical protein